MNVLMALGGLLALFLVTWAAYRIGQFVLRILAGLLFMAFLAIALWYLFIR